VKIGLGTAQFGLSYGISNRDGQTNQAEVGAILTEAARLKIEVLDTAPAYGNSETVLGNCLGPAHGFRLVSKISSLAATVPGDPGERVSESLAGSLHRLRQPGIYGLLLHDADDLLKPGGDRVYAAMVAARDAGKVMKLGASVYTSAQLQGLMARYPLDLIQLPLNVFDQRLLSGGQIRALKDRGIEIHVRSVFLQGLLLMDPKILPAYFDHFRDALQRFHGACEDHGVTAIEAALAFVESIEEVDALICGVNTHAQLLEIASAAEKRFDTEWLKGFAVQEERWLNPALWPAMH
jgi:aryl-alcohol dehydrogenase-like predicted oxidoreductase